MMSRPRQNLGTEIRREQIARAALALIARRGLSHLNIGVLAQAVGVVPSAIYRHYAGKDAVLESVLNLIEQSLLANVEIVCRATPDALERLHLLLKRHGQLVRHHAGIPRVLFAEQIFAGNTGRRRRVYKILQGYLREIGGIVRAGQRAGRIRADVSPGTAAVMFLGLLQPAIILQLMSNGAFNATRHTEQAWHCFEELLRTNGDGARPGRMGRKRPAIVGEHLQHQSPFIS